MTTTEITTTSLNETESVIAEMLRENTGCHFLDSGGAYGRNWERNQGVSDEMWRDSLPASLTFRWDYPEVSLNVFHFLSENLTYDGEMDKVLRIIEDARDTFGLETVETLWELLRESDPGADGSIAGIYGEGEPATVNTYNGEDLLSQVIQYTYASVDGLCLPLASLAALVAETERDSIARDYWRELLADARTCGDDHIRIDGCYVFLQVHGGCDVRGGYTDVRAFQDSGRSELGIFDNARASIYDTGIKDPYADDAPDAPAYWMTDDSCSWYAEGACGAACEPELQKFPLHKIDVSPERADAIVADARQIAEQIEHDARFNTDEERALYLSTLAETLTALPYNRADAYRVAVSLFYPVSETETQVGLASRYTVKRIDVAHGCILVDEDGIGRSPYTGNRLGVSPY